MKLVDLMEVDREDQGKAPPVRAGSTISTKQAADILDVSVSRVRQLKGSGKLKPQLDPKGRHGDRDIELDVKDVQQLKNNMPKKGRPTKDGKDSDESKASDDT